MLQQYALPTERSNSAVKMLKHSAVEIWSKFLYSFGNNHLVWHFSQRKANEMCYSGARNVFGILFCWCAV